MRKKGKVVASFKDGRFCYLLVIPPLNPQVDTVLRRHVNVF